MKLGKKFKGYLSEKRMFNLLIIILIVTTVLDIYTALKTPVFEIAETNPIYVLTGSVTPLLTLTAISTVFIIYSLRNSISVGKIFTFTLITIYLSVGHAFGAYSNLDADQRYQEDPEGFVESAKQLDQSTKVSYYFLFVGIIMLGPIIISFIAFSIAMYFYQQRQPKRDKIMQEIYRLSYRLYKK